MKRYLNVDLPKAMKEFEVALKKMVATRIVGHYQSLFRGKGLEFDAYRNYLPSTDDAGRIDWKASARANELLIREYIEERDVQVFFVIDVSSSMVFGSSEKIKNEYALEMIAALANLILKAGDRVGFLIFNDKIVKLRMPAPGQRQFFILSKALLNPEIYGGGYDLRNVLKFLSGALPSGVSLVLIISDFIGPRDWSRELRILNKKVETVGIMISDPRDRILPDDAQQVVVGDPFSDRTELIDPSLIKARYEKYAQQQEAEIINSFKEAGCDFLKLSTDKSFIIPLAGFFKMRAGKRR